MARVTEDELKELAPASPFHPGQLVAGRYEILRPLGSGAMGVVYEARDSQAPLETRALKAMRADLKSDLALLVPEQFAIEARTLERIKSPLVVRSYGHGKEGDTPFIVMEYLRGRDLASYLREHGTVQLPWALELLSKLASALEAVHAVKVVHRDLKPENIFVEEEAGGGLALKLIDFSVAKDLSDRGTTMLKGTPRYMAPEQIAGKPTERSDIFALGKVAEDVFFGLKREAEPLETGRTTLDIEAAFQPWFDKATAPDPRLRFGSATQAVAELSKALTGWSRRFASSIPPAIPGSLPSRALSRSLPLREVAVGLALVLVASLVWSAMRAYAASSAPVSSERPAAAQGPGQARSVPSALLAATSAAPPMPALTSSTGVTTAAPPPSATGRRQPQLNGAASPSRQLPSKPASAERASTPAREQPPVKGARPESYYYQ